MYLSLLSDDDNGVRATPKVSPVIGGGIHCKTYDNYWSIASTGDTLKFFIYK